MTKQVYLALLEDIPLFENYFQTELKRKSRIAPETRVGLGSFNQMLPVKKKLGDHKH